MPLHRVKDSLPSSPHILNINVFLKMMFSLQHKNVYPFQHVYPKEFLTRPSRMLTLAVLPCRREGLWKEHIHSKAPWPPPGPVKKAGMVDGGRVSLPEPSSHSTETAGKGRPSSLLFMEERGPQPTRVTGRQGEDPDLPRARSLGGH